MPDDDDHDDPRTMVRFKAISPTDFRPTVQLDPDNLKPSWPIVNASLEQLNACGPLALRLGILALIQDCVRDLALADSDGSAVARLRELVEMLAHMRFEKL
jgi:hypothetical protein